MGKPKYDSMRDYVNAQPRTRTQTMIAADMGISHSALSHYLRGQHVPRATALRIARDYGISLEGLLDPPKVEVAS